MQNAIQKFRQRSIVFEKPGILSENLENLMSPTYSFCWNFAHVLYLPMSTKGFVGIFLFYLDFELFEIVKKRPGFYTPVF